MPRFVAGFGGLLELHIPKSSILLNSFAPARGDTDTVFTGILLSLARTSEAKVKRLLY